MFIVDDDFLDALHGFDDDLLDLEEGVRDLFDAEPGHEEEFESLEVPFAS